MSRLIQAKFGIFVVIVVMIAGFTGRAHGQASYPPPNEVPTPYKTVLNWAQFPDGRKWGSTSGISVDPQGHIWAIDRCGANSCEKSNLDPVLEFDTSGKLLKHFGAGMFLMPHSLFADRKGNIWVTDTGKTGDKGLQVIEFNQDGKVLMTLGKAGVAGTGPDTLSAPSGVLVAPNGTIFVADSHSPNCDVSRIIKFSKNGKFIKEWGHVGSDPGETTCPHGIAMDSKGRLFVADRTNNRVDIFTQDGKFITSWTQFGRPSGVFIDKNDILYVTDSESTDKHTHSTVLGENYGYNPGCNRGIRIGSVKDGKVTAFIPDPAPSGATSTAEGVAVDHDGNIYGAEVGPRDVKKYVKQ
jgi:sugar lactone lactonase YvrE